MTVHEINNGETKETDAFHPDNQPDDADELDQLDDSTDELEDEPAPGATPGTQSPPRKRKSKRGGPRPNSGRPRIHPLPEKKPLMKMTRAGEVDKRAAFISELPVPPSFEMDKPDRFFAYIRSIPRDKLSRVTMAFYRYLPIVDMTQGGAKPKYIDVIPGESHQFVDDNWEKVVLHLYGSGNYGCYLNEMNRAIARCVKINTKWDLENYPPIIDPKTLDENHPNNKSYIQYLRQKGIHLPSQIDQNQLEEQQMQASAIETLTNTVANLASRQMTPVPQMQSATEKLTLEGATAVISMVKDNAHMNAQKETQQADPIALVNSIVSVAKEINGGSNKADPTMTIMLTSLATRLEKAEDRNAQLFERLLNQNNTPQAAPKTLLDQMKELREMKELMTDLAGGGGKGEDDAPSNGKMGIKELLIQNLPTLVQGAFGLVDRLQSAAVSIAAANAAAKNGAPVEQAVQQAQRAATAAQQPQQPNPAPQPDPINVPAGMTVDQLRQYHTMLSVITPPILNHLRDKQNGHAFAQWFIDGNGPTAYKRVAALGKHMMPDGSFEANAEGTIIIDIEGLMTVIKTFPPLWNDVSVDEPGFRKFLFEFVEFSTLPEDDGTNESDEEEIS